MRERRRFDGHARRPVVTAALKPMHDLATTVHHGLQRIVLHHGPHGRHHRQLQFLFEKAEQLQRILTHPVAFVHEGEDRQATTTAHLVQLPGALFHALAIVHQHDRAIGRDQRAIRVFREVFVTGRVEQVHAKPVVVELHHRRGHGNAALLFQRQPVGRGVPLGAPSFHRARDVQRPAVQQQLLRERGLAGVGMRNDGKRATALDFRMERGGGTEGCSGSGRRHACKVMAEPPSAPPTHGLDRGGAWPASAPYFKGCSRVARG
jgi:hypothetical protein